MLLDRIGSDRSIQSQCVIDEDRRIARDWRSREYRRGIDVVADVVVVDVVRSEQRSNDVDGSRSRSDDVDDEPNTSNSNTTTLSN